MVVGHFVTGLVIKASPICFWIYILSQLRSCPVEKRYINLVNEKVYNKLYNAEEIFFVIYEESSLKEELRFKGVGPFASGSKWVILISRLIGAWTHELITWNLCFLVMIMEVLIISRFCQDLVFFAKNFKILLKFLSTILKQQEKSRSLCHDLRAQSCQEFFLKKQGYICNLQKERFQALGKQMEMEPEKVQMEVAVSQNNEMRTVWIIA